MLCDDFKERYDGLAVAVYARDWITPLSEAQTIFCHNHREIEMVTIRDGEAMLYVGDEMYAVKKGDTFFVSPYELHYTVIPQGATYVNRCICFDASLLQDTALIEALEEGSVMLTSVVHDKYVGETVMQIYEALTTRADGWRMEVQGRLLLLFAHLKRTGHLKAVDRPRAEMFTRQVLTFLRERYADSITSADAATALFVSQGHFCRQFKQHFGDSFSAYLRRYRLEKSLELLCESSLSVTDIARAVGLDDPAYYTKCFREIYGVSPRTYRTKKSNLI
jgi:AraC-like DNA-binding protein